MDADAWIWLSTYPTTSTRKISPFDQSATASIIMAGIRHGETFSICFIRNRLLDITCLMPYFKVSCFNAYTFFRRSVPSSYVKRLRFLQKRLQCGFVIGFHGRVHHIQKVIRPVFRKIPAHPVSDPVVSKAEFFISSRIQLFFSKGNPVKLSAVLQILLTGRPAFFQGRFKLRKVGCLSYPGCYLLKPAVYFFFCRRISLLQRILIPVHPPCQFLRRRFKRLLLLLPPFPLRPHFIRKKSAHIFGAEGNAQFFQLSCQFRRFLQFIRLQVQRKTLPHLRSGSRRFDIHIIRDKICPSKYPPIPGLQVPVFPVCLRSEEEKIRFLSISIPKRHHQIILSPPDFSVFRLVCPVDACQILQKSVKLSRTGGRIILDPVDLNCLHRLLRKEHENGRQGIRLPALIRRLCLILCRFACRLLSRRTAGDRRAAGGRQPFRPIPVHTADTQDRHKKAVNTDRQNDNKLNHRDGSRNLLILIQAEAYQGYRQRHGQEQEGKRRSFPHIFRDDSGRTVRVRKESQIIVGPSGKKQTDQCEHNAE